MAYSYEKQQDASCCSIYLLHLAVAIKLCHPHSVGFCGPALCYTLIFVSLKSVGWGHYVVLQGRSVM